MGDSAVAAEKPTRAVSSRDGIALQDSVHGSTAGYETMGSNMEVAYQQAA